MILSSYSIIHMKKLSSIKSLICILPLFSIIYSIIAGYSYYISSLGFPKYEIKEMTIYNYEIIPTSDMKYYSAFVSYAYIDHHDDVIVCKPINVATATDEESLLSFLELKYPMYSENKKITAGDNILQRQTCFFPPTNYINKIKLCIALFVLSTSVVLLIGCGVM